MPFLPHVRRTGLRLAMLSGGLRCAFLPDRHDPPSLLRACARRDSDSSSSCTERILEHFDAVPFAVCSWHSCVACFFAIPLRLWARVVVGGSRAALVV